MVFFVQFSRPSKPGICGYANNDIKMILTELKKSIEEELNEPAERQLELFSSPEREEFERNENAMRARLQTIPGEIGRETEAIKARFANIQSRMFPVSVTFPAVPPPRLLRYRCPRPERRRKAGMCRGCRGILPRSPWLWHRRRRACDLAPPRSGGGR